MKKIEQILQIVRFVSPFSSKYDNELSEKPMATTDHPRPPNPLRFTWNIGLFHNNSVEQ
jgi:hypothetical protein